MLWLFLIILFMTGSYWYNKDNEKWRNVGSKEKDKEDKFWDEYISTAAILSAILIMGLLGLLLIYF